MDDIFLPIKGYEGRYVVSSSGSVMSLRFKRGDKSRLLSPSMAKSGYLRVLLCCDGEVKTKLVHRLVADAFIPNPTGRPQVNHIDGLKCNNSANNLEWATGSENMIHASSVLGVNCGTRSHLSKLSDVDVMDIRALFSAGSKQSDIAKSYGVSGSAICKIVNGLTWSNLAA